MFRFGLATFLVLCTLCVCDQPFADERQVVRLNADHQPLGEVLNTIQSQSDIRLVFSNSLVDSFLVFRNFNDPPFDAVRKALIGTPFDFLRPSAELWIIVPKEQTQKLPAEVGGRVFDEEQNVPLVGANVYIEETSLGTTTDETGLFHLAGIPPGKHRLSVSRIGYLEHSLVLSLAGNSRRSVELALRRRPIALTEVVVEEPMIRRQRRPALLAQRLTERQLQSAPVANDGDVFELLHQLPGISRRDIHDVFPHIEGGSATEVLVELDGMPIYVPTFGENRRSVFAAPTIQNVTLHRSGFGIEHGDAMSGVVALNTKDIANIPYATHTSVSLTGLSVNYRKNTPKLGLTGSWRTGRFNNNLNFGEWNGLDFFNKIEYRPRPKHALTFLTLVSRGHFVQSNSQRTQQLVSQNLGVRYQINRSPEEKTTLLVYRTSLNDLQREVGFRLSHKQRAGQGLEMQAGLDFYDLRSRGTVRLDSLKAYKVVRGFDDPTGDSDNFYLGLNSNPEDLFSQHASVMTPYLGVTAERRHWQLTAGVRLPTLTARFRPLFEPRAKLTLMPALRLNLALSAGRYYQHSDRSYASEAKSGDNPGNGEFLVQTDSKTPSYATHLRAESSVNLAKNLVASVAVFRKKYHFRDRSYLARINRWFWSLPLTTGTSSGAEFWLARTAGQLQGWLSYTINHEVYRSGEDIDFRPYFNRDRILSTTLIYRANRFVQAKGQYFASSGYPYRDWRPERVIISAYNTPQVFAANFLTDEQQFGGIKQYALGLTFTFAKFSKVDQFDILATQTFEERTNRVHGSFALWASLLFAY